MKNKLFLLTIICIIIIMASSSLAAESYWQQHYEQAKIRYNENPDSLANNYYKTISMANLGMIIETIEVWDQFEDDFSRDEFDQMFNQEINKIDQEEDRLLYLNYYAFYHLIFDEYNRALNYFEKIIEQDPNNIWPLNFRSMVLIELEKYEEAHDNLYKSLDIKGNKYTRLLLAINYYEQGYKFRAINELRKTGNLITKFNF